MSVERLLPLRVEVYRRTGQRDRFGQETAVNPRQHVVGGETLVATYPCRTYQKSGGLTMLERSVDVFEKVYWMITGLDADIREDDAVRVIDPRSNREVFPLAKVYSSEIKYDAVAPHHQEFTIWVQQGPSD